MRGTVYRVDKLMFIPINPDGSNTPSSEDVPFIDMIQTL